MDIVNSNKFNYKNKIGEFKYNEIKDLVNNISKNTISEILVRKKLNALQKIKNVEMKNKRLINKQKELLNLFDNLFDTILTDNEIHNDNNNNHNNNHNKNEDENKNGNKNKNDNMIKKLNYHLDEIIDKSKSFEEQIKLLK